MGGGVDILDDTKITLGCISRNFISLHEFFLISQNVAHKIFFKFHKMSHGGGGGALWMAEKHF